MMIFSFLCPCEKGKWSSFTIDTIWNNISAKLNTLTFTQFGKFKPTYAFMKLIDLLLHHKLKKQTLIINVTT